MWPALPQRYDGRSPAARFEGGVAEILNKFSPGQNRSNNFALDTDSAAMNDPKRFETRPARFDEILLDDRLDIPGRHRVEVEYVGNRDPDRFFFLLHCC